MSYALGQILTPGLITLPRAGTPEAIAAEARAAEYRTARVQRRVLTTVGSGLAAAGIASLLPLKNKMPIAVASGFVVGSLVWSLGGTFGGY